MSRIFLVRPIMAKTTKSREKSSASSNAGQTSATGKTLTPASTSEVKPHDRLGAIIRLVVETAEAKGWDAEVAAEDKKKFKYATVAVSRTAPGTYTEVTGTFEIT